MARDIEEFLRRAAERRKKQLKQKQGGDVGQPPQPPLRTPAQPPRVQQPPRKLVISDDQIEVVRKRSQDLRNESVTDHVARHIDSSNISEHASHLAEDLEQTDERLEERLHDKFDRDLGSLKDRQPLEQAAQVTAARKVSPVANDLVRMLKSPKTVRLAIILAEVLKRPDFE
jgi:hypothetical protein